MEALGLAFTGDELGARWLLRAIFVLLLMPGRSAAEEREMVERFVAPLVHPAALSGRQGKPT
jgi:hypothetical protein